jgi:hypothetical protein
MLEQHVVCVWERTRGKGIGLFRCAETCCRGAVAALSLGALLLAPTAGALTVTDADFDQIAKIVALGGTVTQVGGTSPGKNLLVSTPPSPNGFEGTPDSQSGVGVSMPDYFFVQSVPNFNDGGSVEPGNTANMLLGGPTDITFTTPGIGGPDGGPGDGSVQILDGLAGGTITVSFDRTLEAPVGENEDLFIFTNTAAMNPGGMEYGDATVELLDSNLQLIAGQSVLAMIPMGMVGSGMGGVTLDIPDGTTFYAVRISPSTANGVEIDGVAAIPEPSTVLLLAAGLAALAARRRR